jgi:hypothetical protein
MLEKFEAIVRVTDARSAPRPERARALAGQIARTAVEELRRPRLGTSNDTEVKS